MLNTFQQEPHDLLPGRTHDEESRQNFASGVRGFLQQRMSGGLALSYKTRGIKAFERENDRKPKTRRDIRKVMEKDPYFQLYASSNRIAQELLFEATRMSVGRQLPELITRARDLSDASEGKLILQENFDVPRYISAIDIHCMPGGYASEVTKDDVAAGALYDRAVFVYAMGFMGPRNDDMGRSVCNYLQRNMPDLKPLRILDMGCTVGHSTLVYKEMYPEAEIWGIDVAAPVLRYAHARAKSFGYDINFAQMNAEETSFEDGYFDLIVSHILLHETSGKAMPRIFEEAHRILKPGGLMIHEDLPPFDKMDEFSQFILDNETWYNNEPFWGAMRELDQVQLSIDAGFPADAIKFDTAPMATMEFANEAEGYTANSAEAVADRDFNAAEFAPGAGYEVLIAQKEAKASPENSSTSRKMESAA